MILNTKDTPQRKFSSENLAKFIIHVKQLLILETDASGTTRVKYRLCMCVSNSGS